MITMQIDPANPVAAEPVPARADAPLEFDPAALAQLRLLDPTGQGGLLRRVLQAFEASSVRLLEQLRQARVEGDRPTMRLVAHTLKSSSAIIGASRLSHVCAAAEATVHGGEPALDPCLDALQIALHETLRVVARMLKEPT